MEPSFMVSESQERMLAVVEPAMVDQVMAVCRRRRRVAVVGEVTDDGSSASFATPRCRRDAVARRRRVPACAITRRTGELDLRK
jgi:phosphoribosylformylglycinamidine (FGAM) synthase-like enzyme